MDTQQTEMEGLDRARAIHVSALNAGDANAWAACFDNDAVQMPPNQPPNVGTGRIQDWTRGFLAAFCAEFSIVPHDVELAGPGWAFERGSYEISLTPRAGGDPLRDSGKYLTIYRRAPCHPWLIAHDIWNSDHQPPSPPAS
jgi:ketosteroid isomerase-like protein